MRESDATLLPLNAVAKRVGRHPATLRKWLVMGKIDGIKVGRDWLFTESQAAAVPKAKGHS